MRTNHLRSHYIWHSSLAKLCGPLVLFHDPCVDLRDGLGERAAQELLYPRTIVRVRLLDQGVCASFEHTS